MAIKRDKKPRTTQFWGVKLWLPEERQPKTKKSQTPLILSQFQSPCSHNRTQSQAVPSSPAKPERGDAILQRFYFESNGQSPFLVLPFFPRVVGSCSWRIISQDILKLFQSCSRTLKFWCGRWWWWCLEGMLLMLFVAAASDPYSPDRYCNVIRQVEKRRHLPGSEWRSWWWFVGWLASWRGRITKILSSESFHQK